MFYEAEPKTFGTARSLRKSMTLAEKILWNKLKDSPLRIGTTPFCITEMLSKPISIHPPSGGQGGCYDVETAAKIHIAG